MRHRMLNRRTFLTRAGALGCSLAASPLVTPITLAAIPGEARLVTIILRGGMDGLDVLRPATDPVLAALRPTLGRGIAANLDGQWGLHPDLEGLRPLWDAGEMGFVQAVSTPYRNKRSHFDGQDILEAGSGADLPAIAQRDGWLNRLLSVLPGAEAETAFAVGRGDLPVLAGAAPHSSWSPDAQLALTPQARLLLEVVYADAPRFAAAASQAMELAQRLDMGGMLAAEDADEAEEMASMMAGSTKRAKLASAEDLARFAAGQLRGRTRIAAFSLSGFDSHNRQAAGLANALGGLQDAILSLREELGPVWARTAVLAMTEFGRTVRENGSAGTDHGTGGLMVFAGGALRGGRVFGDWPGLSESALYQGRDLMPTADVRAYTAWVLRGLYGIDRGLLESVIFPGLDMANDPHIMA